MDASCARDSNLGEKVFRGPRGSLETRVKSCGVNRSQAGVEFGLVQPRAAAVDRRRSNKVLDLSITYGSALGLSIIATMIKPDPTPLAQWPQRASASLGR